ncbi:hypothetical protein XNC3_120056 [Xenorhabdus nematophila F1]|nr:hypothetical protein XNC3_120056 [Xenorhabdus nematophila F1]
MLSQSLFFGELKEANKNLKKTPRINQGIYAEKTALTDYFY